MESGGSAYPNPWGQHFDLSDNETDIFGPEM